MFVSQTSGGINYHADVLHLGWATLPDKPLGPFRESRPFPFVGGGRWTEWNGTLECRRSFVTMAALAG